MNKGIQSICHITAVRMRIVGSGNLKTAVFSLSNTRSQFLADTALESTTNRLVNRLSNFREQGIQVLIRLTAESEYFNVNTIIPFVKESASSYPQQ